MPKHSKSMRIQLCSGLGCFSTVRNSLKWLNGGFWSVFAMATNNSCPMLAIPTVASIIAICLGSWEDQNGIRWFRHFFYSINNQKYHSKTLSDQWLGQYPWSLYDYRISYQSDRNMTWKPWLAISKITNVEQSTDRRRSRLYFMN